MTTSSSRIDEGVFVDIHGVPQWLTLRGDDRANPALLVIGGPGFGYAALAPFFASFERSFTLVQWDQPGAGFTFGGNGDAGELTLERLVRDGVRVAELACARLRVSRLALLCVSGGTLVGLQMVQRRPEPRPRSFAAYIAPLCSSVLISWPRSNTTCARGSFPPNPAPAAKREKKISRQERQGRQGREEKKGRMAESTAFLIVSTLAFVTVSFLIFLGVLGALGERTLWLPGGGVRTRVTG